MPNTSVDYHIDTNNHRGRWWYYLLNFPKEATGTELGLELGVVGRPAQHCHARVSVLCPPHPSLGLPVAEGGRGRLEADLGAIVFSRGKSFPELFEFLQKEEEVGGSSSYLIRLCRIGLSRPASCFHGFPGSQALSLEQ